MFPREQVMVSSISETHAFCLPRMLPLADLYFLQPKVWKSQNLALVHWKPSEWMRTFPMFTPMVCSPEIIQESNPQSHDNSINRVETIQIWSLEVKLLECDWDYIRSLNGIPVIASCWLYRQRKRGIQTGTCALCFLPCDTVQLCLRLLDLVHSHL